MPCSIRPLTSKCARLGISGSTCGRADAQISSAMLDQRELDLIGSRMSAYQFEPTIERFEQHAFNLEGIATHFIPFSRIGEVFDKIEHPDPSVKKMVILFDEEDM